MNLGGETIPYKTIKFEKNELYIKHKIFKYYSSPLLSKNKFKHGFFTKSGSEKYLSLMSDDFNKNVNNCSLNQIHSGKIVFGSITQSRTNVQADGIVCDKSNQNLWVYTADCMPILFADKCKRYVAALHCGRKGLEKRIIKNLIKVFDKLGSSREDILVAIGPSISKKYYLVDKKTLTKFYKKSNSKLLTKYMKHTGRIFNLRDLIISKDQDLIQLDLKKYAHIQLLNENIPNSNIDISSLCTYESENEFNSWRRSKTKLRQWNFISS